MRKNYVIKNIYSIRFFLSNGINVKSTAVYFICIWLLKVSAGDWVERIRDCFLFCCFPLFTGRDGRDGRKGVAGARGFAGPKGIKENIIREDEG